MIINDKCSTHQREPVPAMGHRCETCSRIRLEEKIAARVVRTFLRAGHMISVCDGEEYPIKRATDEAAILAAMFSTDVDRLLVRKVGAERGAPPLGWVLFVYGNDGVDVISDYTESLEPLMRGINEWVDTLEA